MGHFPKIDLSLYLSIYLSICLFFYLLCHVIVASDYIVEF